MNLRLNLKIVVGLAVFGIILSLYLTYGHYAGTSALCPAPKSGEPPACDIVGQSIYSEILGIPVAFVGVLGYLAISIVALFKLREKGFKNNFLKKHLKNANLYVFLLALLGFLFTVYLNYIQIFVLKTICFLCEISATAITIIFIISVINLRVRK